MVKNTKASKKVSKKKVHNSVVVKRINEEVKPSLTKKVNMTNNVSMRDLLDKYCPSSTPVLVPYLEVYRTDELYYKDYVSELNNMSSDDSDSELATSTDTSNSATGSDKGSGSGGGGGGVLGSPTTSRKTISKNEQQRRVKNKNHEEALRKAIKETYNNKANVNGLIRRYKSAGTNFKECNYIAMRYPHWLKKSSNFTTTALLMVGINKKFG